VAVVDAGVPEPDAGPAIVLPSNVVRPALCDRTDRADAVRDLFCKDPGPHIGSLADLQVGLGLAEPEVLGTVYGGAVVTSHSTALSGDMVSEINPRAIITAGDMFVAFQRGIQSVEIVARDRGPSKRFNFYLVDFQQACNTAAAGCVPGDLYTLRVENDWLSVTLDDDEDLKNTRNDCRQCHQRGLEAPVLLMRELDGPWTHFFAPDQDDPQGFPEVTGTGLLRDYIKAKGDELYGNLGPNVLRSTVGFTLQAVVTRDQPMLFEGSTILNERWPWTEGTGYPMTPAKSATWYTEYERFKRGELLSLPYFEPRVSDPVKAQKLSAAYQQFRAGELAAEALPDLADIFPDDPQIRAEIGLQTEPNATPVQLLITACGSCHNDVLDQTISRARFNVALSRMSRAELDLAITRLEIDRSHSSAMPPKGRRMIPPDSMAKLIAYLKQTERPAEDDAALDKAAQMGMAGKTLPPPVPK
jgi:cytochrome c553